MKRSTCPEDRDRYTDAWREERDPAILGSAPILERIPRTRDKLANVLRTGVIASLEADAIGHEITVQPCAFGFTGGAEIVEGIKLHPQTGEYGELSGKGPDGEYHPLDLAGPVRMKYPDLTSLCVGISRDLFLTDVSIYQVHAWAGDNGTSVVSMKRGVQAGGPVFLDHPVWEVELALAIIKAERRYDRMLAFPGQARGVA